MAHWTSFFFDNSWPSSGTNLKPWKAGCALVDWIPREHRRQQTHFLSWTWKYTLQQVSWNCSTAAMMFLWVNWKLAESNSFAVSGKGRCCCRCPFQKRMCRKGFCTSAQRKTISRIHIGLFFSLCCFSAADCFSLRCFCAFLFWCLSTLSSPICMLSTLDLCFFLPGFVSSACQFVKQHWFGFAKCYLFLCIYTEFLVW